MGLLAALTKDRLATLKTGTHEFGIVGPEGERHPVRIHLQGVRGRVVHVQVDLIASGWNFKLGAFERFSRENRKYWDARKRPKGGIDVPSDHGGHLLTFECLSQDRADWLYDAVKIASNPVQLEPLEFR
jgi:hypothetical protein